MFRLVFQNGSIYLILGELKKILKKKKRGRVHVEWRDIDIMQNEMLGFGVFGYGGDTEPVKED